MKQKKKAAKSAVKAAKSRPVAKLAKPVSAAKKARRQAVKGAGKIAATPVARKPRAGAGVAKNRLQGQPALFYRLNTLLHLVRNIAHYEEQLCTILHEIKTTGAPNAALSQELAEVLDDMPSTDYAQELQTVRAVLEGAG